MLLGSVNSLVEVGIGVNLAYGAFKGMRDGLFHSFSCSLKTSIDSIAAKLVEQVNGEVRSRVAVKAEDIHNEYSDTSRTVTTVMVVIALLSAIVLTGTLCWSAVNPTLVIADATVYLLLLIVAVPLSLSAALQVYLYRLAKGKLRKMLLPYEHFIDVSQEITPGKPTKAP